MSPRPYDLYSITKAEGEKLALSHHRDGLEVTVVRPGTVYGPHDRTTCLKLFPELQKGRFCFIDGGRWLMNPVYVDNLVDLLRRAAECPEAGGRVYNVSDGGEVTWKRFIGWICEDLGVPAPRLSVPGGVAYAAAYVVESAARMVRLREAPLITRFRVRAVWGDGHYSIGRARSELGYIPRISTREGIRRTVEWYLESQRQAD